MSVVIFSHQTRSLFNGICRDTSRILSLLEAIRYSLLPIGLIEIHLTDIGSKHLCNMLLKRSD